MTTEPDPGPGTETLDAGALHVFADEGDLHAAARVLGRALVGYGAVGLVIGLAGLLIAGSLLARLLVATGDLMPRLGSLAGSVEAIATAMDDAAASSTVAARTIETTMPSVDGLAETVERTVPTLGRMGTDLQGVSLLGARPLADAGSRFSELAADLQDLGPQLRGLSSGLTPNAATLRDTGGSLTRVASELRAAAGTLGSGTLRTLTALTALVVLALLVWVLAPAVGAILLGRWLLRLVRPSATATRGAPSVRSRP